MHFLPFAVWEGEGSNDFLSNRSLDRTEDFSCGSEGARFRGLAADWTLDLENLNDQGPQGKLMEVADQVVQPPHHQEAAEAQLGVVHHLSSQHSYETY